MYAFDVNRNKNAWQKKNFKMTQVSNTSFVSNWLNTFNPNHANDIWIPETDTLNEISFSDCRRFFKKQNLVKIIEATTSFKCNRIKNDALFLYR